MGKVKAHQNIPTQWQEREKLRDKGQFWTPGWVADAMVSYVAESTELVFDPATGRGAFFDALLRLNKPHIKYFGTDTDGEVLQDDIYMNSSCDVELRDFIKNPPHGKFKAIVANPPYIRHHRIDQNTKLILKKLCARITGFLIDGRAGYHIYFLIQALNLLEPNGRLAFIMPADTCEGTFAAKLWDWITEKYCLECVITFNEEATPFPNVDTNAIIFLIKNSMPQKSIYWVRAKEAYSCDLLHFVTSNFKENKYASIDVCKRQLKESINTGLSRPEQNLNSYKYHLNDFANVMRGIATGANDYFFLTRQRAVELNIPDNYLKVAVGRTKDASDDILTTENIKQIEGNNRPTLLLSIAGHGILHESIAKYLKVGEGLGLPARPLIKQRRPWYKMEKREIPPLLFAYLGRRNTRFIKNEAGVLPLTGFLCVYPLHKDDTYISNLWQALNHPDTLKNLQLVGKSYGSGAIKVEPRNLGKLPIPDTIVKQFELVRGYKTPNEQLGLFNEKKPKSYKNNHS
ncbi:MAG: N-6 DNA methylase [Nitrospirae bacterium]|nr:N-6 DNA methylase [Nitrospirota bacterium]